MFCQIKSTLRYVNIKPCRKYVCKCFEDFEKRNKKHLEDYALPISKNEYHKYLLCRKQFRQPNNGIFIY